MHTKPNNLGRHTTSSLAVGLVLHVVLNPRLPLGVLANLLIFFHVFYASPLRGNLAFVKQVESLGAPPTNVADVVSVLSATSQVLAEEYLNAIASSSGHGTHDHYNLRATGSHAAIR